ncbi:MAG: crossover junction endodeoxyribonuclease RuvC [Nitrospirae bacterium]|nr:MAG: crossover junction endodeoxyribonuclease RuvC [Nitrospirota bacterium]
MKVIGIDPGSIACGFGVVEKDGRGRLHCIEYGTIRPERGLALHERLGVLYKTLTEVIDRTGPDEAAVEKVFFAKGIKAALNLGHARGVALLSIAEAGLPYFEYNPNEIKKAVVGYGKAEKRQVQEMVKVILSLREIPQTDSADALAIAICHLNQFRG